MIKFDDYEYSVIKEIAKHQVEPGLVQQALDAVGKPVNLLMEFIEKSENKYVKKAVDSIAETIQEALKLTVKMANTLTSEENVLEEYKKNFKIELPDIASIKTLSLKQMDTVADTYDLSNALLVTSEGFVLGAATTLSEFIPFAQIAIPAIITADVTASMTFMSRHVCQIATSYGYSSFDPVNIPDILAAMAPTNTSSDEGFLAMKAAVIKEIRDASEFAGKRVIKDVTPRLVEFINYIASRLGIVITEKELGLLIPVAGALVNGGLNLAFQQMNHTNAKDYFRILYLNNKYGEDTVYQAIEREKEIIRERMAS